MCKLTSWGSYLQCKVFIAQLRRLPSKSVFLIQANKLIFGGHSWAVFRKWYIMELPGTLSSLSLKNFSLKNFLYFSLKNLLWKSFLYFLKKAYISEKVYLEPWNKRTFLHFRKGVNPGTTELCYISWNGAF